MSQSSLDLSARLTALHDSLKQTLQLIHDLSKLQPHPVDADSDDETQADLAAEIQDNLKQQEEELELLKLDVEDAAVPATNRRGGRRDSVREREGRSLLERSKRLQDEFAVARTRFRKAQLQAKRTADLAQQQERAAYLASLQAAAAATNINQSSPSPSTSSPPFSEAAARTSLFAARRGPNPRGSPAQTKDDLLLTTTTDVTSSLRRTHALMTSELSRSQFAAETLAASNAALQELDTRYSALDTLLAKSRGLLGSLLRSQKSDTWYLQTALYVLAATIAWLLFRRLLYGPLWWFVWWPIRLVMRGVGGVGGVAGRGLWGIGGAVVSVARAPGKRSVARGSGDEVISVVAASYTSMVTASVGLEAARTMGQVVEGGMSEIVGRLAEASQAMVGGTATVAVTAQPEANKGTEVIEATEVAEAIEPTDSTQHSEDPHPSEGAQPSEKAGAGAAAVADQPAAAQQEHDTPEQRQQQPQGQQHEIRRGDGQLLRERDEAAEPRNPKKRMWEEPPVQQQREL